jgi:two-component system, NtrC family, response regulator HydG
VVKGLIRTLIVEDNEDHMALDREYLPEDEFAVDWAPDAATGMSKLENGTYDIAILDYELPDGTGIDLLRAIKEKGIDVKVILLTNYDDPNLSFEALKLGALDYIVKGYRYFNQLRNRILENLEDCEKGK